MPTVQQLLNTVDVTYRNSYSAEQKVQWMDVAQKQIFQRVPKDAPPFIIHTEVGVPYYPLPADCDRSAIKAVTLETSAGSNRFAELNFFSLDSILPTGGGDAFYSLLDNMIFLNPTPNLNEAGRKLILLYRKRPVTLSTLGQVPEMPEDFQELLILGCLERVARARGEVEDKNNFASDYSVLLQEYLKQQRLQQPEYYRAKDVMPSRNGRLGGRRWARDSGVADLIPPVT